MELQFCGIKTSFPLTLLGIRGEQALVTGHRLIVALVVPFRSALWCCIINGGLGNRFKFKTEWEMGISDGIKVIF
jgi:hypothetical protein